MVFNPRWPEWGPPGGADPTGPAGGIPSWEPGPKKKKRRPQPRPGYGKPPTAGSQLTALKPGSFTL